MTPAHGRPPSKAPKTTTLPVKLSEVDVIRLEYVSKKLGISKAEVLRRGLEKLYLELVNK